MRRAKRVIEEPTVNLTPLIDVVFVILIMFILIAPLLELDQVELADSAPHAFHSISMEEASPITIHVLADNTIWFNKQIVALSEIPSLLGDAKRQFPKATPQVIHDKRAQFGTYQGLKNAIEESGFEQLNVVLKPT